MKKDKSVEVPLVHCWKNNDKNDGAELALKRAWVSYSAEFGWMLHTIHEAIVDGKELTCALSTILDD